MESPNLIESDRLEARLLERIRRRFPTEHETDALLQKRMARRNEPPYIRPTLAEMTGYVEALLECELRDPFEIRDPRWFTGGVSKIQLGFTLAWNSPDRGASVDRLVVRMDPAESLNTTSRVREWELLRAFDGILPVPKTYWLDSDGRFFPEPALVYEFVPGVTKPRSSTTGQVTGLGTVFGPHLRSLLGPQFVDGLARIHTFDYTSAALTSLDVPAVDTAESALWQLNRARRVWEEDRGEDFPLMEVAANWLERNAPPVDRLSVVHGDYRSGNFLYDEDTVRVTAWLDWERGHLGDRHRDLAWTTQPTFGHFDEQGREYYVCGLVPLNEFYERYTDASGLSVDPDRLRYYTILNCYQIIVALLGTAYRVVRLSKSHQGLLLARLKGEVAPVADELLRVLREV